MPIDLNEYEERVMGGEFLQAQTDRIEALLALVDRLGSPELTLGEAKGLRGRLLDLTWRGEESGPIRGMAPDPSIPSEAQPPGAWTPECRSSAA